MAKEVIKIIKLQLPAQEKGMMDTTSLDQLLDNTVLTSWNSVKHSMQKLKIN